MQKGFTGQRPTANILRAELGMASVLIYNNSAVNLYLGDDNVSANANNGVPIVPAGIFNGLWEGDLWVGADVDNTEFRYMISKALSFDNSQNNSSHSIFRTAQGFLSPKSSCSFILFFLLAFFGFVNTVKAQVIIVNKPIIGNRIVLVDNQITSSLSQNTYYLVTGAPTYNSGLLFEFNNTTLVPISNHVITNFSISCTTLTTFDIANLTSTQIANLGTSSSIRIYSSSSLASILSNTPNTPVSVTISNQSYSPAFVYVPSSLCNNNILISLGGIGTPNSDTISITGNYITSSNTNSPIAPALDPNGVSQFGLGFPGTDSFSNNLVTGVQCRNSSSLCVEVFYPYLFNGTFWDRSITCPNTSTFSVTSTITQVIPLIALAKIRICSFDINPSTVTAGSTDIVYGTGANCGTGTTTLTGAYTLPAAAVVDITPSTLGATSPLTTPQSQAVCVRAVTSTVNGFIVWE